MQEDNYYYCGGTKVVKVDYARYRRLFGDYKKRLPWELIDYDYIMAKGNEHLRDTIQKIENIPNGANIEPYQDMTKPNVRESDLQIHPLYTYVEAKNLEKMIDNEPRLYPWYKYNGQDVVIVRTEIAKKRNLTILDKTLHMDFSGDGVPLYWGESIGDSLVPLREARFANISLCIMMGYGDRVYNSMKSIESLCDTARKVYIDMSNRRPDLLEIREILNRHNGKEIKKFMKNNEREYFDLVDGEK